MYSFRRGQAPFFLEQAKMVGEHKAKNRAFQAYLKDTLHGVEKLPHADAAIGGLGECGHDVLGDLFDSVGRVAQGHACGKLAPERIGREHARQLGPGHAIVIEAVERREYPQKFHGLKRAPKLVTTSDCKHQPQISMGAK